MRKGEQRSRKEEDWRDIEVCWNKIWIEEIFGKEIRN
jgi:hypothetical protein